jgi:hypothetical protein
MSGKCVFIPQKMLPLLVAAFNGLKDFSAFPDIAIGPFL